MQEQDVKTYANMVDAFVMNANGIYINCPRGMFKPMDILKKMWFKIQVPSKVELPDAAMVRSMWLKPCRIENDGSVWVKMEDESWASTGFTVISKESA